MMRNGDGWRVTAMPADISFLHGMKPKCISSVFKMESMSFKKKMKVVISEG